MSRYRFIHEEKATYPIAALGRVLHVARSAYYAWARRGATARARADAALAAQIAAVHARIHAVLRAQATRRARQRVARLMRAAGLVADPAPTPAPNLVARDFTAPAPDRLWLGDITYVAAAEGWLYLAILVDVSSRRVVGWAMAEHLRTGLAPDALAMAPRARCPTPDLVHHTDRGSQYTAATYRTRLAAHAIGCPMSRSGDCLDNAMAERCFATLKANLADAYRWPIRAAARTAVFAWIEVFWNRQRRHSALTYRPPLPSSRRRCCCCRAAPPSATLSAEAG